MAAAFAARRAAPLAERLFAALRAPRPRAATSAGASRRRCSSCPREGEPWRRRSTCAWRTTRTRSRELRRLLAPRTAPTSSPGEADELIAAGRHDEAGELYARAAELAPESDELLFWAGLALAQSGDLDARRRRRPARRDGAPGLADLLDRLAPGASRPAGRSVRRELRPLGRGSALARQFSSG